MKSTEQFEKANGEGLYRNKLSFSSCLLLFKKGSHHHIQNKPFAFRSNNRRSLSHVSV